MQAFKSPLWYYLLAFTRIFSSDLYLNAIILSLILLIATIYILRNVFQKNDAVLFIGILLWIGSIGFYDFTSSGLENGLGYFLIAVFTLNYLLLFTDAPANASRKIQPAHRLGIIFLLLSLILCVRHDLGLLLFPAAIYAALKHRRALSRQQWIIVTILAIAPFGIYTLFSLIYYGAPLPNTAYAKLNTGIEKIKLVRQGIQYIHQSLKRDTITILIILGAVAVTLFRASERHLHFLAYGILLDLLYIVYIGGDFMLGRFLSYAYMLSTILLLLQFLQHPSVKLNWITAALITVYLIFYPHTPLNSPLLYSNQMIEEGVADERGFYTNSLSLYRYIDTMYLHKESNESVFFPPQTGARLGYQFGHSPGKVTVQNNIGIFGYFAGTEKIIIDPLALSDPLLARLPVTGYWRIGHFPREIPEGYVESVQNDDNLIKDQKIKAFYQKLRAVTQDDDLFTWERLKTIVWLNLCDASHLLHIDNALCEISD